MKERRSFGENKMFRAAVILAVAVALFLTAAAAPLHAEAGRVRRASSGSEKETPQNDSGMIKASLLRQFDSEYDEDLGWVLDIYHDEIILTEESRKAYPALADTVEEYNRLFAERTQSRIGELSETLRHAQEGDYPFFAPLTDRQEIYIRRADPVCFSFVRYEDTYDGGAHGYYSYFGISADPVTGDVIELEQVVNDITVLPGILEAELKENYPDAYFIELEETLESYTEEPEYEDGPGWGGFNWCLDPQGITFFFSPYEIASYADGAMEVTLLFEEYPEIFTGIYGGSKNGCALNFNMFEKITYDADSDGSPDSLMVTAYPDEYETYREISFFINGEEYIDDEIWAFEIRPVLFHTDDGKSFLYLELTEENDYRTIEVYDLSGDEPEYAGHIDGGFAADGAAQIYDGEWMGRVIASPADPADFGIEKRIQILSTMNGTMRCAAVDNGMPDELDDYWMITNRHMTFTLKQGTEFDRADESGKVVDRDVSLSKGTKLHPYRTDTDEFVDVRTDDGSIYRVYVDRENGWPQKVNGIDLDDLFEGVLFAG